MKVQSKKLQRKESTSYQIIGFSQVLLSSLPNAISCPHSYVIMVTFSISVHFQYDYYYVVVHYYVLLHAFK